MGVRLTSHPLSPTSLSPYPAPPSRHQLLPSPSGSCSPPLPPFPTPYSRPPSSKLHSLSPLRVRSQLFRLIALHKYRIVLQCYYDVGGTQQFIKSEFIAQSNSTLRDTLSLSRFLNPDAFQRHTLAVEASEEATADNFKLSRPGTNASDSQKRSLSSSCENIVHNGQLLA